MLCIDNLSKSYDHPVIKRFSYSFPEKGLFFLRGKSGSGKTTLLRLIAGLEKPDKGTIRAKSKSISMVFQEDRLLPFFSLMENILLVKKERDEKKAESLLLQFGLLEAKEKFPSELSGGMRLRASIVRSLYFGGDIYLWDEPTKELDPDNRALVIQAIKTLSKEALVIVVTHDSDLVGGTEITLS